jgi:hypothetical protein
VPREGDGVISSEQPFASWFLIVSSGFFVVVYAVPLLLFPLRWARWFRWDVAADHRELTVYLGRCTGALALAIVVFALRAVSDPKGHRDVFDLIALACGLMAGVHVWGALRRAQPWTEDLEIVLYGAACAVAVGLRWSLS